MDQQAKKAREMAKQLPIKKRISHFWEYHKTHTLFAIFLIALIGTSVYQALTQEKYDLEISYYGVTMLSAEEKSALEEYLSENIEDIDLNGEKNVRITEVISDVDATLSYQSSIEQKLIAELTAGVCPAYLLDESFYKKVGPDTESYVMETGFDIRECEKLGEFIAFDERPIYWCTRNLYEREQEDEKAKLAYQNAKLAETALRNDGDKTEK